MALPGRATTFARPLLLVLAVLLACASCTGLATGADVRDDRSGMTLGLAGPFSGDALTAAARAGVSTLLVEMTWREAEPARGRYDTGYLRRVEDQIDHLRAAGFGIALNTGLQDAPGWLLDSPGGRFVDQDGLVYRNATVPNLVFGTGLRGAAQDYLHRVLALVGDRVDLVRAGGGISGELSYPYVFGAGGLVENRYWAFDTNAARTDPVPGWRPGQPSPRGEAGRFLTWYLDALVDYQHWQVDALRAAGYHGTIAMLYPSSGLRPGDVERAVAANLSGGTSPEINGEVQRGYDFARQVEALTDANVAVYGTWGENLDTVRYLAGLAHETGRQVMAENAGPITAEQMTGALRNAEANGLAAFYLIRADSLLHAARGLSDFSDVEGTFRRLRPP